MNVEYIGLYDSRTGLLSIMVKHLVSHSDFAMAEYCAKVLYESLVNGQSPPEEESLNFLYSLARLTANKVEPGPNVENFRQELNALYAYTDIGERYDFMLGAIYGSAKFYKAYSEAIKPKD